MVAKHSIMRLEFGLALSIVFQLVLLGVKWFVNFQINHVPSKKCTLILKMFQKTLPDRRQSVGRS